MFRILFLAFQLISTLSSYSLDKIEAQSVLELDVENTVPWNLGDYCVQPFFLKFELDNDDLLKIYVIHYTFRDVVHLEYYLFLNIETGEITRKEEAPQIRSTSIPLYIHSPVKIENHIPIVEGFQFSGEAYYDFAILSSDKNFLGVNAEFMEFGSGYKYYSVGLTQKDSSNGVACGLFNQTFNMSFSPSEGFFYCRGNQYHKYSDIHVSLDEYRATLETTLIRLSDQKQYETHGDVAFTTDERYFVTERDLMPTLVEAQSDHNLLQYNMPSRLVAAAFSPDQQQLFLTGTDNKLYIFDSHLPSGVGDWMLQ